MKRNPKTKTVSCAFDRETWRAFEQLTRVMGLSGPQGLRELVTYAVQNTSFEDRRGKGPFSPTTLAYGAATVRANMPKPEPAAKPRGSYPNEAPLSKAVTDLDGDVKAFNS